MSWENGIGFDLGEELSMIRDSARDFATSEVAPLATKIDREHYFPEELIPKLGALGFLGIQIPSEYGGADLSTLAYCSIVEELSYACASTGVIVSAHNSLCVAPIVSFGTEEQKKNYLPDLASGNHLGCFALSEPGTGSDAASLTCMAKKVGNEYVISGTKNWITNGPVADTCVLFAMQDPTQGSRGVTAFVHSMELPGVSVGKAEEKLGICGSQTSSINYTDVKLTTANILGSEFSGFKVAMQTLNGGRLGIASQAIGIGRAALKAACRYAGERKTFGKFLHEHQTIQNYLADMITRLDASRYLTWGAAAKKDRKEPFAREAAQAKLFASESASWIANKALQIHGGYGYVKEYSPERHLRDAKITEIYEGTSEIQRMVIAAALIKEQ